MRNAGKGVSSVGLVLNGISAFGNANSPVGMFILVAVVSFGIAYSFLRD